MSLPLSQILSSVFIIFIRTKPLRLRLLLQADHPHSPLHLLTILPSNAAILAGVVPLVAEDKLPVIVTINGMHLLQVTLTLFIATNAAIRIIKPINLAASFSLFYGIQPPLAFILISTGSHRHLPTVSRFSRHQEHQSAAAIFLVFNQGFSRRYFLDFLSATAAVNRDNDKARRAVGVRRVVVHGCL
ncbi:hypothetical protein Droror1_Dr00014063 [Drosera rotundifolia]